MWKRVGALGLLSACSFTSASPDASPTNRIDAANPPPPPLDSHPSPRCPSDSALILCLSFDGYEIGSKPRRLTDDSPAQTPVDADKVEVISGREGSPSLRFEDDSEVIANVASSLGPGGTLESWVRIDNRADAGRRYGIIDDASSFSIFYRQENDTAGGWLCGVGSPQVLSPVEATPLRQWTHVAVTCDGSNLRIYVNGRLRSASSPCADFKPPAPVYIGADKVNDNGNFADRLQGALDDIRIWRRALTDNEVCLSAGRSDCL